jgi:hypothetical protein
MDPRPCGMWGPFIANVTPRATWLPALCTRHALEMALVTLAVKKGPHMGAGRHGGPARGSSAGCSALLPPLTLAVTAFEAVGQ